MAANRWMWRHRPLRTLSGHAPTDDWIPLHDAAARCKVSTATIKKWVDHYAIPLRRIGGRVHIEKEALDTALTRASSFRAR
jgi:excisionase family DNA binding protein